MKEIMQRGDIILFIDELHNLVGAGAAEGAIDAASILKPALARGELQTIGATTLDEYRKYLERDAALERRFQQVRVEEPTIDDTVQILRGLRDRYEAHHRCQITDEALRAAAELADRYIQDRHLPDKAIDLIDEAALAHPHQDDDRAAALPRARGRDRAGPQRRRKNAIEAQEFEKAASLRDKERKLTQKKQELEENWRSEESEEQPQVGEDEIADIVSMWTGIPVFKLTEAESQRLDPDGGGAAQARDRPARGDRRRLEVDPPRRAPGSGSEAADRLVHLPRPVRRREDGAARARSPSSCSATRTR